MDGLLVVDKPAGPTSHDVVARVRRALGEGRVGHTGTLDPAASGVLPLVLGRATRLAQFLTAADKVYEATFRLGVETDTYDCLGQPLGPAYDGPAPSREVIERALDAFRGTFLQTPPAFSAKRVAGRRSYKTARANARGKKGPGSPHPVPHAVSVTTHSLDLVEVEDDRVAVRVHCSAGFYVRSLAHDLGERLGTGAHLAALRRTRSGDSTVEEALPLDLVERDPEAARRKVIPPACVLPGLAAVVLTDEGVRRAAHGRELRAGDAVAATGGGQGRSGPGSTMFRLLDRQGSLIGIAETSRPPGLLHPRVVLL